MTTVLSGFDLAHRLQPKLPEAVVDATPEWAEVKPNRLLEVCTFLRDDPELDFRFLSSLTGVDRLTTSRWSIICYRSAAIRRPP